MFGTQYSDYTMDHHKYSPDLIHTVSDFSMAFSMHLTLLQQIPTNLCHFIPPRHLEQQTRYKTFTVLLRDSQGFGLVGSTICPGFFLNVNSNQPLGGGILWKWT